MDNHPKTFKINRSKILIKLLKKNGWHQAKKNEKIYFSYWNTYNNPKINKSELTVIPRNITCNFDNKRKMYLNLLLHNLTYFLPTTYTEMENIDPNIFCNDKIFFLKDINSSSNKGVHVIKTFKEFLEIVKDEYSKYILQEEVKNMYLINGSKCVIRSYGLITKNPFKNYLYHNSKCDVYVNKYDRNNTSNSIHNDEYNSVQHFDLYCMPFNNTVFPKMKNICSKLNFFFDYETSDQEFIIIGYDFILDNSLNPILIEMNAYPNLGESNEQPIKNCILECFANLYILKNNIPHYFIDVNS